jgi:hypothetical protein
MNAYTLVAGEYQTHDFYLTVGPMFSDPLARQLYAEIAAIEEQHVTQYEFDHRSQRKPAGEMAAARS